jgi:SAM-dependent methyltransferase
MQNGNDMSNNDKQRAYWNSEVADNWVTRRDHFDRTLAGIGAALMAFADLKPGMDVLDIGCGAGATTEHLAARVAPGHAVGLDISTALVAAAKARSGGATRFIEADASVYPFLPEFDLVFSRLGVMFFADPVASFANIRRALKPGGRLAFLCWCPADEIVYLSETFKAARDLLPAYEPTPDNEPGPFGLADSARTRRILEEAGWRDIRIERTTPLSLLGTTLDEAVEQVMNMGPLARLVREISEDTRQKVRERVAPVLRPFLTAEGVCPPAACWLVGANAR